MKFEKPYEWNHRGVKYRNKYLKNLNELFSDKPSASFDQAELKPSCAAAISHDKVDTDGSN